MHHNKMRNRILVALLALAMVGIGVMSCSRDSVVSPSVSDEQGTSVFSLQKGKPNTNGKGPGENRQLENSEQQMEMYLNATTYPQNAEMTLTYDSELGGYKGGTMKIPNGTMFHVHDNSLVPPNGNGPEKPVTITMSVNKIKNAHGDVLEFTFGPSGTEFKEPAEIRLCWQDLGLAYGEVPEFYYVEKMERM